MLRKLFLFLLLIVNFSLFNVKAQDTTKTRNWTLNGYLKDMEIFVNSNDKSITSNLIHNRLNFKWYINSTLKLDIEDRNQLMFGEFLRVIPDYGKSFEDDKGLIKLSHNFYNKNSVVLNSTIDRLFIDYTKDKLELTIGRQRINWGQTFVWNPNDIFNAYSFFDFDYEERPGSDAIRIQYYLNETDKVDFASKVNINKQLTAAGLYKFNNWSYDFQILGGIVNGSDYFIGAGWAGEIHKGGFRGELSYFHRKYNFIDTSGILVGSIAYDYTFKNSLALQAEVLYNGNTDNINSESLALNQNGNNPLSAKNPFLAGISYFASVSYPFTPLFSGSLSAIYNQDNNIFFIIPSLVYSISDNIDLTLLSQTYFIDHSNVTTNQFYSLFLRLKWSF